VKVEFYFNLTGGGWPGFVWADAVKKGRSRDASLEKVLAKGKGKVLN